MVEENQKDIELAETLGVDNEQPDEQSNEETANEAVEQTQQPNTTELRFKTIREARERAELERDQIKEELERLRNLQTPTTKASPEQDYSVAPDDLVEGKHLSKYDREIKKIREELNGYKQQANMASVDARLKSKYPDFDSVVSHENVEMLRTAYPELAATLHSSPDLYNQAASVYTLIKQFGLAANPKHQKDHAHAQANAAKPRPISAVNAQRTSDSPLSRANAFANGLTPELKAEIYREMVEARSKL